MIIRVNNDVILGLTTGHWSRQAWPQCDIIIDPTYHRFPYVRTGQIHNNREKVPTFVYIIVNIPAPCPLNKGDSRPRHLQGKRAYTGLVRQAWGFSLFGPM